MVKGRVSVVIPARGEQKPGREFLGRTLNSLLANASGDLEIVAVLDGEWVDPPLPNDKRLKILHRGKAHGMRAGLNAGSQIATGEFLMKLDAHCAVDPGFDEVLKANCDDDWMTVPRRLSLDPDTWGILDNGKSPVDAHALSWPYEENRPGAGLHGQIWPERSRARKHIIIDDDMSSQGSCWFTTRKHWDRLLYPMDEKSYGSFIQEGQELMCKTWLSGGAVKVVKATSYRHVHKGKNLGRGYWIAKQEMQAGSIFAIDYWMHDRWPERKHNLRWLIEKFGPKVPTWPDDLDEAFRPRKWNGEKWALAA